MGHETPLLNAIRDAWGWTGLEPSEVVAANPFGNVIVRSADGCFWRICPEASSCKPVARNAADFDALWATDDFQFDWRMERLVGIAVATLGPVVDDRCYCLKVPAIVGGRYVAGNLGTISRAELIAFSGDLAAQIKDVPHGAQVTIRIAR